MDFSDILRKRRSIRKFQDKEISVDIVKEIIKDSCLAPSSGNRQPWKFIIINNKDLIKRLSDESKKNLLSDIENNPDASAKRYESILRRRNFNVFYNAPCLVFIVGPENVRSLHVDCALAASYFMFSATTRGLGTCWIGLGAHIRNTDILKQIGMPEAHRIVAPIILGYPNIIPSPPHRNDPCILKILT